MRLSLRPEAELIPKSDIIQLIEMCNKVRHELVDAFKERMNRKRNTRYSTADVKEMLDDDDRMIDYFSGGSGLTPEEYKKTLDNSK